MNLVGLLGVLVLTGACGDQSTRVRLVFTFEEAAFKPDFLDVIWGVVGADQQQRTARIPASGDLPAMEGNNLGSVLIILSGDRPEPRRFVARGTRGSERVSGSVRTVPWDGGHETTVMMSLGCYDDPEPKYADPVPGCKAAAKLAVPASDGGPTPPSAPSASSSDAGN